MAIFSSNKLVISSIPNVNKDKSIGFAGDWTVGPTIEDAFVSGEKVVKNLL